MTDSQETSCLSIGAVSEATDIPVGTLRTWERRYDFPEPERTEAGHRRYRPEVIDRLRLARRAVDAGHRPSDVVGLPTESLEQLLAKSEAELEDEADAEAELEGEADAERQTWLDETFAATAGLDVQTLEQLFQHAWDHSGALPFLTDYAAPFLERLGAGWASGLLGIADEHLASHKLRQLLSNRWRTLAQRTSGPVVLLATPENELHSGGLHMAAVVFALAGWRIVYLGANTPKESVVDAATDSEASVVGISIAGSYGDASARSILETLRDELPEQVDLVAGGHGVPDGIEGVIRLTDLEKLYEWAAERA